MKKRLLCSIFFMLLGILIGYLWCRQHVAFKNDTLQYGITEQNLSVQSVLWKDYPKYRELTFTVDGNISFHTKKNGTIVLNNLSDSDSFEEMGRNHRFFFDGSSLLSYDFVTYKLNSGRVTVNIPKIYSSNPITYAVDNSYYLTFNENDAAYTAGCISVSDTQYTAWTEEEIRNSDVNLDAYLTAFTLSGTYDTPSPLHQKPPKEGISLTKEEESIFSYTIDNSTTNSWSYENHLPHIELWYKGVWIELISPFDYNSTVTMEPLETRHFEVPKDIMRQYPTPFPGVYRLVIYGENKEFIVSDTFNVSAFLR